MSYQQTLKRNVEVSGLEPYGGKRVDVTLKPAEPNTGIVFQTQRGDVKNSLYNARQHKCAVMIDNGTARVLHVEHFLATLYAYGIDNVIVDVKTTPSRSYKFLHFIGSASDIAVLPTLTNRQRTLCDLIDSIGLEPQNAKRGIRKIPIGEKIGNERLSFQSIGGNELVLSATTHYKTPGKQTHELVVNPGNFKVEVSDARSMVKHLPLGLNHLPEWILNFGASIANPSFGWGHGFSRGEFFFETKDKDQWKSQERQPAEIARHTIVDRLGAIALLGERLEGALVKAKFSGHQNDIDVLKEIVRKSQKYKT